MGRPGKGLTTSLDISTKIPNKKQKARFYIPDITKQDIRTLIKKFDNSPYIGYKLKQVHNIKTEDYFFLIKQSTKPIKIKRRVRLRTNGGKLGVNETIGHINEKIGLISEKLDT